MRTYPLVPQVGALGGNAPPPDLQLPSAGLKPLQLLPLCGVILCYVICTFKGVIVHHLILTLLKHMHMNRLTCTGIQGYTFFNNMHRYEQPLKTCKIVNLSIYPQKRAGTIDQEQVESIIDQSALKKNKHGQSTCHLSANAV